MLTLKGDPRLTAVDGPYSKTKEIVGGYFVIKLPPITTKAVRLASDCPHLPMGPISVRQVDFMGNPEP